ncbi:MAG: hypothetical protein EHM87_18290 [Burkholderiales bacterium]|nr:MAG: hypothetical protein EHM87_18290 [Burkholderiales bacterium]
MADALDPRLVYSKTAAGVSEIEHRGSTLSPPARRVLVLVDGRRPLAALPAAVRPGELPKLIDELQAAGLIALSGIVEELPGGATDLRDPRLEDFKRRIEGAVLRELGPAGMVLEARLQDCVNMTVLRGVMREIVEMVRIRAGDAAAARVSAAAQAAHGAWGARGRDAAPPRSDADPPAADAARPKRRDPGRR